MHRLLAHRLAALVVTVLLATAIGHVFLTTTVHGERLSDALLDVPSYLVDTFVHRDFGTTAGGGCPIDLHSKLCASYGPQAVAHMLRERVPVDLALITGGLLLGALGGIAGGRWCAIRPASWGARALKAFAAFQLSCPPYFQAFLVLIWFSWNSGDLVQLPFVSGQGDYRPFGEDPLQFIKAMWVPWLLLALPLAALLLRITDARLREVLDEDYVRTARAKGLYERRVIDRHALPAAGPVIAAMTGVNISTLLINMAVIEYGFAIPGLFRLVYGAANSSDVAVLQAMVVEGVILIVLANFLADTIHTRLDPRLRP